MDEGADKDIQTVLAIYPNATAMSDYNDESIWSFIRTDRDADGLAVGEILGIGLTQRAAWKDAAEKLS